MGLFVGLIVGPAVGGFVGSMKSHGFSRRRISQLMQST